MNRTDAPKKQPIPFAVNGHRENLLNTTPAGDNTASYNNGFPPVTMILKAAGGLPPKGQDMNQILFELSSLSRWFSAGTLNGFDSTFASSISGYPKGSVLLSDDGLTIYISTTDGNTSNPNTGGSGWKTLVDYLGLNSGAPAIGIPFYWPSSSMPNTVIPEWSNMVFLKNNGSTFSSASYPKLALVYPSLTLPDTRGEFIRNWDDGRGVDASRALLSAQGFALQNITGNFLVRGVPSLPAGAIVESYGAFQNQNAAGSSYNPLGGASSGSQNTDRVTFDASRIATTSTETRPRNIAYNFLVRAK